MESAQNARILRAIPNRPFLLTTPFIGNMQIRTTNVLFYKICLLSLTFNRAILHHREDRDLHVVTDRSIEMYICKTVYERIVIG
jgi:hypothetical protein